MASSNLRFIRQLTAATACLAVTFLACAATQAFAFNVYKVGSGIGCQYSDIQAAVDAAAANPGEDFVWIASNKTYANEHVVVTGQDVIIEGGFTDCTQNEPTGQTLIQGTSGHSVFEIEGSSNVELGYLEIVGGQPNDQGGGVYFGGDGGLNLVSTWVHSNQANYGGGVAMNPSGSATLYLYSSTISVNTAFNDGGGIQLMGSSTLYSDSGSYITGNAAPNGYGGGIKLQSPANVYVSSSVNNNTASYGGGIASFGGSNGGASVYLYSTDATNRVALYHNTATQLGGGVYLSSSSFGQAGLCAQDFSLDANIAIAGSAVFADQTGGVGSTVYLNDFSCTPPSPPVPAVACATGTLCNEIADNISQDSGGNPTSGAAIDIASGGQMVARRFAARRNIGSSVIYVNTQVAGHSSTNLLSTEVHECLMADNVTTRPLIEAYGGADNTQLVVDTCTLANNTVDTGTVPAYTIAADVNYAVLTNSIVYDLGALVVKFGGAAGDLTAQYDLVNNSSTMPADALGVLKGPPSFVDVTNQDYHLVRTSLGVDYAPALADYDLDGNPRPIDLADVPNVFGPTDLGAYEIQTQLAPQPCSAADTIFCDGFDGF